MTPPWGVERKGYASAQSTPLDEALIERSGKAETEPKIRKWFQDLTRLLLNSKFDPEPSMGKGHRVKLL
jgi:hypothetical protein